MALDDDDIPLLTHRLSEGMASSYYSQRCTGNSVAFAQITYARCFFIFQVASTAVVWWGAGMVICLERDADLHMAQLMPLPLTISCFCKIQIGFTFLVPAHPGSPGQRAVKLVVVVSTAVVIVFASWFLLCDVLATVATFYSVVVQCLFFALILVTYCIILPFC